MEWTQSARQPFSLQAVRDSHGWIRLKPFVADGGSGLRYVTRLDDGRVLSLRLTEAPGGVAVHVPGNLDAAAQQAVSAQVTWMLGLDRDLGPFYAAVSHEAKLAHAAAAGRGRILRSATLFEDVIKTILTTNTAWGGTIRMNASLVDRFGEGQSDRFGAADPEARAFPTPEALATAGAAALKDAGLGYRAPYVAEVAAAVTSGELDLEGLRSSTLETEALRRRLLAIKGVGGYAAANLLLLLGRTDYIPIDSWARKMVSQEWHDGAPVTDAQVEEAFAAWGRWRGLCYWFWDWDE